MYLVCVIYKIYAYVIFYLLSPLDMALLTSLKYSNFNHFSSNIFQRVFDKFKFWLANNSSPLKRSIKCMKILFCPCSLASLKSSPLKAFISQCLKFKM